MYVQAYMYRGWVYMNICVEGGGWVDEAGWSASGFLAVLSSVSQCQAAGDYLYPRLTISFPVLGGVRCDTKIA